jgi:hypothetical protein
LAVVTLVVSDVPRARAGLFEELYRGLDLLATPLGFPVQAVPGGGLRNGNRFGRLRIVPNEAGQGYRMEFDRTFGIDQNGRPEILDVGVGELELAGTVQGTMDYTNRGLLIASGSLISNGLNYSLRFESGLQDAELTGTLAINDNFEINQFGFYEVRVEVQNNNSTLTLDGVLAETSDDTAFDIGPIDVQGNIFYDMLLAALTTFGVDTTELEAVFPRSGIDRIDDEIANALRGSVDALTGGAETAKRITGHNALGDESLSPLEAPNAGTTPLPEPASLALAAAPLALLALLARRRR